MRVYHRAYMYVYIFMHVCIYIYNFFSGFHLSSRRDYMRKAIGSKYYIDRLDANNVAFP